MCLFIDDDVDIVGAQRCCCGESTNPGADDRYPHVSVLSLASPD
ncbi:Uncharacterised protein [Mycobacteroides abscessus subsp. abscessus]|nr:Uncharacterised protein [Mycobacteroides abscessus subsp. abscessus]